MSSRGGTSLSLYIMVLPMWDKIKALFGGKKETPEAPVADSKFCSTCNATVPSEHTHDMPQEHASHTAHQHDESGHCADCDALAGEEQAQM